MQKKRINNRGPNFDGRAKPTLEIQMEPKINSKLRFNTFRTLYEIWIQKNEIRDLR